MSTPVQRGIASGLNQALIHLFILSAGYIALASILVYALYRLCKALYKLYNHKKQSISLNAGADSGSYSNSNEFGQQKLSCSHSVSANSNGKFNNALINGK